MDKIFDIASNVSTPLALAGFLAAAFFYTVRLIISRNIFPSLTARLSSDIIKLIIVCLFILSLVAMILGFAGFIVVRVVPPPAASAQTLQPAQVATEVAAALKDANETAKKKQAEEDAARKKSEAQQFREAQINLEWIFGDNGAVQTYNSARQAGKSRYQAALQAQSGENQQGAYRSIVAYGEQRVERYLQETGR